MATEELRTIRALSQYRPFEGGGASVAEAHADLALAAFAEAGGSFPTVADLKEAIRVLFRIDLPDITVAGVLNELLAEGRVIHPDDFRLTDTESKRLDAIAAESEAIAAEALAEWRKYLVDTWTLTGDQLTGLVADLGTYLKTVIKRHGVEASLLLYPESEQCQALYAELEAEGSDFLPPSDLAELRDTALSQFIRNPTAAQKQYLAQNLNTGYFLTVLSIDPAGAELVRDIVTGQRVYLDTNFLYRLMGVQGPRFVKPAEAILQSTLEAGYEVALTPWSLDEFRVSLKRSQDFLARYPIPPAEYATIAADAASQDNFVTAYWRQVRSGVKPQDFFDYYAEIETQVKDRGIVIADEGCKAVDAQTDEITDQMSILAKASHGRYRHPATLEHDVKHRMLVMRLRGEGRRTFSNAGYWFLTHDSVLPRYDHYATEGKSHLPFCVSAGAWFQVVEAFRPKTDDLERSLADMLASPYVRYRRTLSQQNAVEVVGRVNQYKGGSPELATRVFMNSAAVAEIEAAVSDEQRVEKIDLAIVEAARQAQEEAHEARAVAEQERERADEAVASAQARAAEAEKEAALAIAAADAARRIEVAAAEQRAQESLRAEQALTNRALAEERHRHDVSIKKKDDELRETRRTARAARRRLWFFAAFVISVVAFLLLDLAIGLKASWSALLAVAVLVGLGLGISQWTRWRTNDQE